VPVLIHMKAVFNRVLCPSYQGFRIYRETLSHLVPAASSCVPVTRVFAFIVKRFRVFRAPLQWRHLIKL
ncbi:hypothetical protein ACT6QE_13285, partial [Staphylococcus aureus]